MSHILVTGGAGYIGSHTVLQLLENGHEVTVLDNLSNSSRESLRRVENLTGGLIRFIQGDLLNPTDIKRAFANSSIEAVIHFAGLKAVGESVSQPIRYYQNNVHGTMNLCEVMQEHEVKTLVFSSSATVYGDPQTLPLKESMPTGTPTNPYGQSKLMVETILRDLHHADGTWRIALLRYFNPVGAHESGEIGEDPSGIPNNLMPFIAQVATGKRKKLSVFGNDYNTHDGTGVRDYIHVEDLADGHLKALQTLNKPGLETYNLGTGQGYSVLDMVKSFEKVNSVAIPHEIVDRRPGDVASCYACPKKAKQGLNWEAKRGIDEMCRDTWHWQSKNPNGYFR
ncbi:UDP-glucose 4-epimerase [Saliniradius amylolyticus]|uniref:UDP-glucose 4-epimerase n=1 Tax=Saliniradius amylolyticus TaxID=2183582 RepID=A0A2S2E122_9ALTE|nr:UDP-glucose 4-epimerase GalE [Saliniradius amylolyticus]AWL11232.1 UDP-glucose 4-epimerase [Saliniradius amylolyticus]